MNDRCAELSCFICFISEFKDSKRYKLENDTKCGVTTGGEEECYWDCRKHGYHKEYVDLVQDFAFAAIVYSNPECMRDCFPQNHCMHTLLDFYSFNGGICPTPLAYQSNLPYPTANLVNCFLNFNPFQGTGLCGDWRADQTCFDDIGAINPPVVSYTFKNIYYNLCEYRYTLVGIDPNARNLNLENNTSEDTTAISRICQGEAATINQFEERKQINVSQGIISLPTTPRRKRNLARLNPIYSVGDVTTTNDFEHTKHRYPWICSLRSNKMDKTHFCAVTLLRRPPGPIVMITAAHCVFTCKSGSSTVDNCCCSNVRNDTCSEGVYCGDDPTVEIMTGEDAEVICGEWEIGTYSQEESGEDYNIIFKIEKINIHPDFNISRGSANTNYVIADIATIHVEHVDEEIFEDNKLYPACLPKKQELRQTDDMRVVHAGWSSPPPLSYLTSYSWTQNYVPLYRDFHKQWHYSMEITECRDPTVNEATGPLQFPTNTYYPKGLVCAKENARQLCPSSGESGSPLMIEEDGKYTVVGILSFVKGCTDFGFYDWILTPLDTDDFLVQISSNPLAYTRLTCYLPWISKQYGLKYEESETVDSACVVGTGNIEEDADEVCLATSIYKVFADGVNIERECIFPFYLNGQLFDGCFPYEFNGLVSPVFMCPTFSTVEKIDGINSYTAANYEELIRWTCLIDPNTIDPSIPGCPQTQAIRPFFECKNNCPGGKPF